MDASHVYVRALVLGCFYSHISTQTFRRALTASVDSCAEIKQCPFSGVTKSGRVWRKVPESDARSVGVTIITFKTLANCFVLRLATGDADADAGAGNSLRSNSFPCLRELPTLNQKLNLPLNLPMKEV